jgi:hypothetical protein
LQPQAKTTGTLVYLSHLLERGRALAERAALDEAARTIDSALEEGARVPHRLAEPGEVVTAMIVRVSIAHARGEEERARVLLERLVRYDPAVELLPEEDSPRLRAALDEVRARLGRLPPLEPADLGEACRGRTLVVARRLSNAGEAEMRRYDDCRPTAVTAVRPESPDEEVVAALTGPRSTTSALTSPVAPAHDPSAPDERRPVRRWLPWVLLGSGVVLGAAGAWGLWSADEEYQRLKASPCGEIGTCAASAYEDAQRREILGVASVGVGAALFISGGAVWWIQRPEPAQRRAAVVTPAPAGMSVLISF